MPAGKKKLNCRQKKPKLLRKSWMLRSVKKQKQTNMQKCRMQMRNYTAARKMPRHQQYEAEKEAAAIRAKGLAEAEAIRQKGLAEAEALDKKAEAMKKYGQAAILEMIVGVLPDIAKSVAEPLSAIDKVTVIGGNSNGVSDLAGNVPIIMGKVMESVKEATGIDMNEIIRAETFEGKTTKNINFTGLDQVGEEIAQGAAQSVSETVQETE